MYVIRADQPQYRARSVSDGRSIRAGSVSDRSGARPRANPWGSVNCVIHVSSIVGKLKPYVFNIDFDHVTFVSAAGFRFAGR